MSVPRDLLLSHRKKQLITWSRQTRNLVHIEALPCVIAKKPAFLHSLQFIFSSQNSGPVQTISHGGRHFGFSKKSTTTTKMFEPEEKLFAKGEEFRCLETPIKWRP